ncbi:hypothetical protein [Kutzneria chonburiensis]|uniref:Uncharacterized protein n=1 Tax=Kutzneria chonburiensis TaxID=1483604 RepID=A0ABV6MRX0_9PSEU|nr:hypothetical protein [Kutzneria chonburiensis]
MAEGDEADVLGGPADHRQRSNVRSFYSRGGLPCEAPAAAETLCPDCHRGPVQVVLARQTVLTAK